MMMMTDNLCLPDLSRTLEYYGDEIFQLSITAMDHGYETSHDAIVPSISPTTERQTCLDIDDFIQDTKRDSFALFENSSYCSTFDKNSQDYSFFNDSQNIFINSKSNCNFKNEGFDISDLIEENTYFLDNVHGNSSCCDRPCGKSNDSEIFMLRGSERQIIAEEAKKIFDSKELKRLYDEKLLAQEKLENNNNMENLNNSADKNKTKSSQETDEVLPQNHTKRKEVVKERTEKSRNRRIREQPNRCYHLWDFLRDILTKTIYPNSSCVEWVCEESKEFRIRDTKEMAKLWGKCKNSERMTYDKLSRAIRYYCTLDILKKTEGKRLQFKFSNGKMWTKL